tara:strand:- start:1635 stop:2282 length:648 start_codon:yes stop_codon:yes gene_type:complete
MKKENDLEETEGKIQADCYQWFHNTHPHLRGLLYHVPNGEKRDKITAAMLKAKGVVPGIPDLVFNYRKRTYFIEMKKPGKGVLSKAQKEVHSVLDSQGFIVWVIDNLEDFKSLIETIIKDSSQQFTHGLTKEDFVYKNKVFSYLYGLADGELVEVSHVCEENNQQKFVNNVSDFIIEGYATLDGFNLMFTPDYKAFYRKDEGSKKEINYKGKIYA